jgi:aryl-alcohol dehydrogenase-like predicted oxidoreductase
MQTRTLGNDTTGTVAVGAIGLGEMPMSLVGRPDEEQAIRTIHAALGAGVTLIDTADAYCAGPDDTGHGERLVARALAAYGGAADQVLVATKGGHLPPPGDGGPWPIDGTPDYLRRACDASLAALGVDAIGLYQHHRPDPRVPYAETIGVMRELYEAGKVRMVGISNADTDQIKVALDILGPALVSVQNQYAPNFRSSEPELHYAAEAGLAFLPWSPLGGIGNSSSLGERYTAFAEVANEVGASPQQICLAWMLAKAPTVIPIPGSSRPDTILDSAKAADLSLNDDQLSRLDATG